MWSHFATFFNGEELFQLTPNIIYEFFNSMINENYTYGTLLSYRSAMYRPIKSLIKDYDLVKDDTLCNLLKFAKTHLKKHSSEDVWDLDKVVVYLKSIDDRQDVDLVFKKCFFLVLLANPKRISEFKAFVISKIVFFDDNSIILKPHSKFLSKNHTNKFCPKNISIPQFPQDLSICPVRHLKMYLSLTKRICSHLKIKRPECLWIDSKGKPLNLHKMRSWFRDIVLHADPQATVKSTNFHSIRGVAASALEFKGASISEIAQQMQWSNESTFINFYSKLQLKAYRPAVIAGIQTAAIQ